MQQVCGRPECMRPTLQTQGSTGIRRDSGSIACPVLRDSYFNPKASAQPSPQASMRQSTNLLLQVCCEQPAAGGPRGGPLTSSLAQGEAGRVLRSGN